jgi:Mg/Co/Ni transporter MgtE
MIYDRLDALSPTRRQVWLIRLANELEDRLDLNILDCDNPQQRREYTQSSRYQFVEMAHQLGFSDLAVELECAFHDALTFERCDLSNSRLTSTQVVHSSNDSTQQT